MAKKEPRYYWIRFLVRFFREDGPADYLLSLPNGSEYVVLYLKLWALTINSKQCLATQCGNITVPYDYNRIQRDAKFFGIDTVRNAMYLYEQLDLIRMGEEGIWQLHCEDIKVGSEGASAGRMAIKREKDRLASHCDAQNNNNVTPEIRDRYMDRYTDIDIDIDTSIDDDIISIINLYNEKMNKKERKTAKIKETIKNALMVISVDEARDILSYVATQYHRGRYGDFEPRLSWCLGSGLNENRKKIKIHKNNFCNFEQRNYDMDALERELLDN